MATHEIVHMVAMRHAFVTTTWTMGVLMIVRFAIVLRCAGVRISSVDGDGMFIHMFSVQVVHVSIVEIVSVSIVFHRLMPALRRMRMIVDGVLFACAFHELDTSTRNGTNPVR